MIKTEFADWKTQRNAKDKSIKGLTELPRCTAVD